MCPTAVSIQGRLLFQFSSGLKGCGYYSRAVSIWGRLLLETLRYTKLISCLPTTSGSEDVRVIRNHLSIVAIFVKLCGVTCRIQTLLRCKKGGSLKISKLLTVSGLSRVQNTLWENSVANIATTQVVGSGFKTLLFCSLVYLHLASFH